MMVVTFGAAVVTSKLATIVEDIRAFASELSWVHAAVVFGSRVRGSASSDIDFKLLHSSVPSPTQRRQVAGFARALHARHAPGMFPGRTDVPYARKTLVAATTVEGALGLVPFRCAGHLMVPPIRLTRAFLRSDLCQMRTVLSALTTPHVLAWGEAETHTETCRRAFAGVLELVCATSFIDRHDWLAVRRAMLVSPDGRRGKDYLGYSEDPVVVDTLRHQWERAVRASAPRLSVSEQPGRYL